GSRALASGGAKSRAHGAAEHSPDWDATPPAAEMAFLFKSAATPAETLRIRRVLVIGVGLAGFLVGGAGVASVAVVLALLAARVPKPRVPPCTAGGGAEHYAAVRSASCPLPASRRRNIAGPHSSSIPLARPRP